MLIVFYGFLVIRNLTEKKVTEAECMAKLFDSFGLYNTDEMDESEFNETATGRFMAARTMKIVAGDNLEYLGGRYGMTDDELVCLAEDYGIINHKMLDEELSEKDMQDIIDAAWEFYYNPNYFPEYDRTIYKEGVVDNTMVNLISYNEEDNTALIEYDAEEISDGTIMILETKPGICRAYEVYSAVKQEKDFNDENNKVDFRVTGEVEIEGSISGKLEQKILIFEGELPIAVTGGTVSVGLKIYLETLLEGGLYVSYELNNVGVSVQVSKNQKFTNASSEVNKNFNAKITMEIGPDICPLLKVLGYEVLNPSIDLRLVCKAETLDNNLGYEDYPKCVQVLIVGPTIKLNLIPEENVLNKILKQFGLSLEVSKTFIDEDNANVIANLHYEQNSQGEEKCYKGTAEAVCTHIIKDKDANKKNTGSNTSDKNTINENTDSNTSDENTINENTDSNTSDKNTINENIDSNIVDETTGSKTDNNISTVQDGFDDKLEKLVNEIKEKIETDVNKKVQESEEKIENIFDSWLSKGCGGC